MLEDFRANVLKATFAANGKRQIQIKNFLKWENNRRKVSNTILMDETGVKLLTLNQKKNEQQTTLPYSGKGKTRSPLILWKKIKLTWNFIATEDTKLFQTQKTIVDVMCKVAAGQVA